ncbi:DUF255 domain-containing protein [Brevibacterium luteolum]|uniref:Thioredoxin domain-containing protein n=1 Tax=Brevibacterium luteolum TaxID=199591 RepID=A0A849AW33_9MICO|nr:uncharacterized protein YyaL (SSP411 family) [Brevibacterium luteolum]NNG80090.1 thioredoxin domain-containing protein [Brevibacterium luteolum]
MANRLRDASSPYLRQHADNPVDWWPWCAEAFDEARSRDVPVLVSIGYSTCHWCHVMAAESFADAETAAQLNADYVSIKVDREELPTVDAYYMDALQAMRGAGGWPMTVIVDHDGRPFFTGTYFPPRPRPGQPAFRQVLSAVTETWRTERERVDGIASHLTDALAAVHEKVAASLPAGTAAEVPGAEELTAAVEMLEGSFDARTGGFGPAPKFPPLMTVIQLITHIARVGVEDAGGGGDSGSGADAGSGARALRMVRTTMSHIAAGGMRDQVEGGIARYSVDGQWHVPHFEKMLYDNALYIRATTAWFRLEQWLAGGGGAGAQAASRYAALAAREARETIAYLRTTLTPEGTFAAAIDADSLDDHGRSVEGAYYTVAAADMQDAFPTGSLFTAAGNVEGRSVVTAPAILDWLTDGQADQTPPWEGEQVAADRQLLLDMRADRAFPHVDDKTVTEWDALAVTALAEASLVFAEPDYADTAREVFAALLATADLPAGRLPRSSSAGKPGDNAGGLADWAGVGRAAIALELLDAGRRHEVGDNLGIAVAAARHIRSHFIDTNSEPMRCTDGTDPVIGISTSDPVDNVTPAGRTAAAELFLLLAELIVPAIGWREPGAGESGDSNDRDADGDRYGGGSSTGDGTGGGRYSDVGRSGDRFNDGEHSVGGTRGDQAETGVKLRPRSAAELGAEASDIVYGLLSVYRPLIQEAPRGCGWALYLSELLESRMVHVTTASRTLAERAARYPLVAVVEIAAEGPGGSVPESGATVCRDAICLPPLVDEQALTRQLDRLSPPRS